VLTGLQPAELPADAIEVGRVADAWGVKGWFKVLSHSAQPEALFSSKCWFLLPTERGKTSFAGSMKILIEEAKVHSGTVVALATGISDRTAAEGLRGSRIFVSRSSFPKSGPEEYYWVDLIGLSVVNREDVALGTVKELLSTGPQTVLVLEYVAGDSVAERMIPFVSVYVDRVDLDQKRIHVDWQADY
jgi:16S rRNA processing protein RimM